MCWELEDREGAFPSSPNFSPHRSQNKFLLLLFCSVLIGAYSLRLNTIQVIFHEKKTHQTPSMASKAPPRQTGLCLSLGLAVCTFPLAL